MDRKSVWSVLGVFGVAVVLAVGTSACGGETPPPASPDSKPADSAQDKDTDGDGVPDSADKCPDKKEDGLAPEPKDGCPAAAK
jgi:hypothetical protein